MNSREEIADWLKTQIRYGILMSKRKTGESYAEINRLIKRGILYPTSYRSIVSTDEGVRDRFEVLVSEGRIMDFIGCNVKKNMKTLYEVNMACAKGNLLRFEDFGKRVTLFID